MQATESQNPLRVGLRRPPTPLPCTVVIFGATGDLGKRKLYPALYNLALQRLLPQGFTVVGFSRQDLSDEEFRRRVRDAVNEFSRSRPVDPDVWASFEEGLYYVSGNFDEGARYDALARRLDEIDHKRATGGNHLLYLATPPSFFATIIQNLGAAGLGRSGGSREAAPSGWTRVVVEKPFGRDLQTAFELNEVLHRVYDEDQIFRIDHYLGKETVQNILVFRFGNGMFEPIWNRNFVDNVQITVAESLGVEGRGGYYEEAGALRDMVENHMMQLLSLVGMEPPLGFDGTAIRDEKAKVVRSIRPIPAADVDQFAVRGQYTAGSVGGDPLPAYRGESGVAPDSSVETYVALKLTIDNWRWAGVPFYLRHGKALPRQATEVAVTFKEPPQGLFSEITGEPPEANVLVLRIQPDEGIELKFAAKVPGSVIQLREVQMEFLYGSSFGLQSPDAYETLLLDCMLGDSSLFMRSDEVEAAWRLFTPILQGWQSQQPAHLQFYEAGSWGPPAGDDLVARDGRHWRRP